MNKSNPMGDPLLIKQKNKKTGGAMDMSNPMGDPRQMMQMFQMMQASVVM
jgi:hypothetical protein